ncbi:YraN family protein [Alkaliphilus transvaalensis]|uniref:YraN family protein n=1 Tax=Alkaliphilus transvaalensis TaxID=114628 RepID=UPI00047B489B|nr:YraN family protein [Alkaliphilus transvaalensis]
MKKELGNLGEDLSSKHLRNKGYNILYRNYRTKFGEIDIIAEIKGYIIFVEVKTRSNKSFGLPREAVNYKKQRNYYRLAEHFIQNHKHHGDPNYRFDVIEVYKKGDQYQIEHIENAF